MEKVLRSLIQEVLPLDLRVELDLLSRRRDLGVKAEKQQEILKLLRNYDIPNVVPLGPGTNRYAAKIKGFVVKFATDHDGKIDNFKEFKVAKRFYPDVSRTHEVAKNGSLLVAEYIPPFQSFSEMLQYADKIREKLARIGSTYLIGDVGVSSNNYANWGIRVGTDDPVCLDYAYAYEVSSSLFLCNSCKAHAMMIPNRDFTEMHCPSCNKKYTFEDIRGKIGNDVHNHEIGDLSEEGYVLTESGILTTLDTQRSNYLVKNLKKMNKENKNNRSIGNQQDLNDSTDKEEFEEITNNEEDLKMSNTQNLVDRYMQNANNSGVTVTNVSVRKVDDGKKTPPVKPDVGRVTATVVNVTTANPNGLKTIPKTTANVVNTTRREPSRMAFSGTISQEPSLDENVEAENVPVIVESNEEPVIEDDGLDANDLQPTSDMYGLDHEFVLDMKRHVSEISNRIGNYMRYKNLYDSVKGFIIDYNLNPNTFYRNTQNCIFRSLMVFLNFTEEEVPNKSGKGTHKNFIPPSNIPADVVQSLLFIQRITTTEEIYSLDTTDPSILELYHHIFDDDIQGIQIDWKQHLVDRIKNKIPINSEGADMMANFICIDWCCFEPDPVDEDDDDEEDDEDEATFKGAIMADPTSNNIFQNTIDYDMGAFYPKQFDITGDRNAIDADDDEDNDYISDNDMTYLDVNIYQDDDFDVVRIISDDVFDDTNIPLYTNLKELDIENYVNLVDVRNGHWDWLSAMVPDLLFRTSNPDPWLRVNEGEPGENQAHIIILNEEDDGNYIMGIFYVGGVYIIDEGVETPQFDDDLLDRINVLVERYIGGTPISHLKRSLSEPDLIYPEEYIEAYCTRGDEDDDDEEDDEDEEEESTAEAFVDMSSPMSDVERAGLKAAMDSLKTDVEVTEDEYDDDTPEPAASVPVDTSEQTTVKRPGTFKPIRRHPVNQ